MAFSEINRNVFAITLRVQNRWLVARLGLLPKP